MAGIAPRNGKVRDLLPALQASGASFGEVLGLLRSLPGGRGLAQQAWAAFLAEGRHVADMLLVLLDAAEVSPRLAEELLQVWFRDHSVEGSVDLSDLAWIRRLPPGTVVPGHLGLNYCHRLGGLPPGMRVERNLEMDGCRVKALPEGFWVGGDLWAEACTSLRTLQGRCMWAGACSSRVLGGTGCWPQAHMWVGGSSDDGTRPGPAWRGCPAHRNADHSPEAFRFCMKIPSLGAFRRTSFVAQSARRWP